jgi:hypothetical protein
MLAEKLFLTADQDGRLSGLPILTPYEKVEVVVLRPEPGTHPRRRQPSPVLRGSVEINGDLSASVFSEQELDEMDAELEKEWRELYCAQEPK